MAQHAGRGRRGISNWAQTLQNEPIQWRIENLVSMHYVRCTVGLTHFHVTSFHSIILAAACDTLQFLLFLSPLRAPFSIPSIKTYIDISSISILLAISIRPGSQCHEDFHLFGSSNTTTRFISSQHDCQAHRLGLGGWAVMYTCSLLLRVLPICSFYWVEFRCCRIWKKILSCFFYQVRLWSFQAHGLQYNTF